MNSILITGCNRGLGLGLVKALLSLQKPPQHIIATCRSVEQAKELKEISDKHNNVHLMEIDLCDFKSYDRLIAQIDQITQDAGLNVLFNNAGIAPKSTRITTTKETDLMSSFQINVVAPILLSKACLPLLKKAVKASQSNEMGVHRAAIINMSSILGSIKLNKEGAMYAYRTSKSAINAATKSLSIDLYPAKILCISLHPGWVRTDMGGSKAPLNVETSTTKIVETMFSLNDEHNGGFYQYDGKQLPW